MGCKSVIPSEAILSDTLLLFLGINCHLPFTSFLSRFTVSGSGRCKINNGGCWHDSRNGHAFSACSVSDLYFYL